VVWQNICISKQKDSSGKVALLQHLKEATTWLRSAQSGQAQPENNHLLQLNAECKQLYFHTEGN